MDWYSWQGAALILRLAVQPGAKRDEFVGLYGGALKVRIQRQPVDGRANQGLIEFVADAFAAPRSQVSLIRGAGARQKVLRIDRPARIPVALHALGLSLPSGESRN